MLLQKSMHIAALCVLIFGSSSLLSQENVEQQPPVDQNMASQGDEFSQMLSTFLGGGDQNPADMEQKVQSMIQALLGGGDLRREDQKRTKMLHALPDDLRERVDQVSRQFNQVAEQISIEKFFNRRSLAILDVIKQHPSTDKDVLSIQESLAQQLEGLHKATKNRSFLNFVFPDRLGGNPNDLQNMLLQRMQMPQQEYDLTLYTRQDVIALRENLEKLIDVQDDAARASMADLDLDGIVSVLRAIEAGDARVVSQEFVELLRSSFNKVRNELLIVMQLLVSRFVALPPSSNIENDTLRNALQYWRKELKGYRQSITEFLSLAGTASIDLRKILQAASWTNEVINIFFNRGDDPWMTVYYNAGLLASMTGGMVLNLRGEAAYNEVQKTLLGRTGFKNFTNPMNSPEYMLMSLVQWVPMMLQERVAFGKRMNGILRSALRVLVAWGWYAKSKFTLANVTNLSTLTNMAAWKETWKADDINMRIAMADIVGIGQNMTCSLLSSEWNRILSAPTREKINDYSMGLVNSNLIDLGLDILVPWLMTTKKSELGINKIADFKFRDFLHGDVHGIAFRRHLQNKFKDPTLSDVERSYQNADAKADVADIDAEYARGKIDEQLLPYIKYRLLDYALANAGAHWGSAIARYFKRPIIAGAKAAYHGAGEAIGYIFDDGWEWDLDNKMAQADSVDKSTDGSPKFNPGTGNAYISPEELAAKNAKVAAVEEGSWNWDDIKDVLVDVFHEYSPYRNALVGFLKTNGQIGDTVVEPGAINDAMVSSALNFLTGQHLLKHSQAAKLFYVYYRNSDNIIVFVDELIEVLKESFVGAAGGIVGRGLGTYAAWYIMDNYLIDQK